MTTQITEPPLLFDINDETLTRAAIEGNLQIPFVPCNTQAVEPTVKLITGLSLQASSYEERHGRALVTLIQEIQCL